MSYPTEDQESIFRETVEGFYRKAEKQLKAAEAEIEFHGLLAGLKADGRFDPIYLENYAREVALVCGERASDEFLQLVNLAIGTEFDRRVVDSEALVDDRHGAEMLQIQVGYADHLEAHLRGLMAADAASFTAGSPTSTARRLRPSGLAN